MKDIKHVCGATVINIVDVSEVHHLTVKRGAQGQTRHVSVWSMCCTDIHVWERRKAEKIPKLNIKSSQSGVYN